MSMRPAVLPTLLAAGLLAAAPALAQEQAATTVCHYTGSDTAPYVMVVAPAGGAEHASHPQDVIPAPADGCPATPPSQGPATLPEPAPATTTPDTSVTLCHATPGGGFAEITVRPDQAAVHGTHPGDIVPAPAEGCPAGTAAPGADEDGGDDAATVTTPRTTTTGPELTPTPSAGSPGAPTPIGPAPGAGPSPSGTHLARTGFDAWQVLWAGLALMLTAAGLHLRRMRTPR